MIEIALDEMIDFTAHTKSPSPRSTLTISGFNNPNPFSSNSVPKEEKQQLFRTNMTSSEPFYLRY
jgi:hypothetical protein